MNKLRALAFAAALLPATAAAQVPQYPQTLPPNTVVGRLGSGSGPAQAIPFATLSSRLTGASTTLNSGNGQTAPGVMSPGNTYSFGATTDTVQMKGLGLGGAAPATGLEIYNAAVTPTGVGQGMVGASSINGGGLIGQGSVYDSYLGNSTGAVAAGVPTGTQNFVLGGTLTAASLSTAGTIAGSICSTSAGLILYKAGVNCYTVSGISVAGGKTLTVNNTITLNGTDGTTFTYPGANDTLAGLGANQTFTGTDTFSGTLNITGTGQINGTAFGTFATQNYATPPAIGGTTPNTGAFSTLTATTPIGLSSGGTNASTAAGARSSTGLNVDGYTPKGDTNYTMVATDRTVGTSATFTAPRTWTLPGASAVNAGQELLVIDMVGGVTNTNTLTISRAGSDTINSGTSVSITVSNGAYLLKSDGVSRWTAQQLGAQATVGVSSINGQTGNPSIVAGTGIAVNTTGGNISVANTGATSIAGNTGAFTLSHGLTNSTNDLQIDVATQRGYIAGLALSTAGSSTTFSVAAGVAVDSTNADFMKLTSSINKTTGAWAVGTGNGALDTGSIAASTWYHVYLIKRTDTGVVDVLISLSASAPTLPTNYTLARRIGSMKTNGSSQWTKFVQNGDAFTWDIPVNDVVNVANPGTAAVLRTLSVPTGVSVTAIFGLYLNATNASTDSAGAVLVTDPAITDSTPSTSLFTLYVYSGQTSQLVVANQLQVRTNTSSQIRTRISVSTAGTNLSISTSGWVDSRGKDN